MRMPQPINDFVKWRWAPCVGLTAGSLTFVALAILLIPTQFDTSPGASEVASSLDRPSSGPTRSIFGASLTRDAANLARRQSDNAPSRPPSAPPAQPSESGMQQRGFSPVAEREPQQPAAVPTASPAPVPDTNGVILQQPDGPGGPSREVTNP